MYATWKLSWKDPKYGVGPEQEICNRGFSAVGIISDSDVISGTILGTVSDDADLSDLEEWNVRVLTNEEALEFAQSVNSDVTLDEEGNLVFPPLQEVLEEE